MKSKKTASGYQVRNKNNDGIRYYSSSLTDALSIVRLDVLYGRR